MKDFVLTFKHKRNSNMKFKASLKARGSINKKTKTVRKGKLDSKKRANYRNFNRTNKFNRMHINHKFDSMQLILNLPIYDLHRIALL